MQTSLRKMGNSTGMILPKEILRQIGAEAGAKVDLAVENDRVVLTLVKRRVREGWAEDAALVGAQELTEEERDWLNVPNEGDAELTW